MNIFNHRDSFFGCLDTRIEEDSLLSLFHLAKQIKLRLGVKGYLLDRYLSHLFEGLTTLTAFDAASNGSEAGSNSQSFFSALMDDSEPHRHPLGERMHELYQQQSGFIVFQERYTRLCILLFPMADELLVQAATEFVEKQVSRLNGVVEEIRVQKLYAEIAGMAGESMLENLNTKIRQRFMIAPMALVFAQGMNDELLYRLISRDDETSKQMFQLLLDSIPSEEGV